MATDIVIPQVGESITEGVIAAWLVGEGEHVDRDAPVLEIETDGMIDDKPRICLSRQPDQVYIEIFPLIMPRNEPR